MSEPARSGTGRLIGIGLGPGDPELMTLKAVRCLKAAPVVAYFRKKNGKGHARTIVEGFLRDDVLEISLPYPMTTEVPFDHPDYKAALADFYAVATEDLANHLAAGLNVALLCEGDPLFYGSFMHLFVRLRGQFEVEIVPGVSGMSGCWTAAALPMSWGDDVLTVMPGTLPADALTARLRSSDAAVIMKIGTHLASVRAAVADAGLMDRAIYVERGTMAGEIVMPLSEKSDDHAPYFSVVLIGGHGRRPEFTNWPPDTRV